MDETAVRVAPTAASLAVFPKARPGARLVGSPLGRTRSFVKRGDALVEVWLLEWPSLVTDGERVFTVEPGQLLPGTL